MCHPIIQLEIASSPSRHPIRTSTSTAKHTHTSAVAFSATMRTTLLIAVCAVAFVALAGVRAEETADSDVLVVTDATMNKVLEANADSGVLLEFYAPWCVCQPEGNVARRGVGLR